MKRSVFLLCIPVFLLLILLPVASAVPCSGTPFIVNPTTSPPGPYGTIYIETSPPGAVISVNGDEQGKAPVTLKNLWPGTYTISARLAGYQEYTSVTTMSGSQYSSVFCRLVPDNAGNGLYVLSTPPNADVYLDGVLSGVTPLMQSDLSTGTHSIQVRLSGYDDWKSTIEVPKGGTRTIAAILIKTGNVLTRGIRVSSSPGGATVTLDGLQRGVTPKTLNNIAAGIHVLEIDYPGYDSWKSTINVPETEIKEVSINLTPKTSSPGWITVSSRPDNASVTLDGMYVGRTPANSSLNLDTITPGEHIIALVLPGYQPYSTRTSVSPRLVSSVSAVLIPAIPASGAFANGTLTVISDPAGATIFMNNRSIGISPFNATDIAAGNHQVRMSLEGYLEYTTSILVTPGNTSTVSATLLPVTPPPKSASILMTVLVALGMTGFLFLQKKSD